MGYDLYTVDEDCAEPYFRWNIFGWPTIMTLASTYGWKPAGTIILPVTDEIAEEHNISRESMIAHNRSVEEWDGSYCSNDGATVTAEDASRMADAIESCLDDIPDFPIKIPGTNPDGSASLIDNPRYDRHKKSLMRGSKAAFMVHFSGKESKTYLRKFIKFLRQGAYNIH